MTHIEKSFLKGKTKFIVSVCVWLLIGSHTIIAAQNHHSWVLSNYPFLWNILDMYCDYNLSGPNNIDDLVRFIDITEPTYSGEFHYKTIREVTIPKLINDRDRIRITTNDCEYSVILGDTLLFHYDSFPCCDLVEYYYPEDQPLIRKKKLERELFLFRNSQVILDKEDLIAPLVKKLKIVYQEYPVDKKKIIFLGYLKGGSLFNYCKSNVDINSSYYKKIEKLLNEFCKVHDIDEIYLYVFSESSE